MATDPSLLTATVPSPPTAMASDLTDKINRLTLARLKHKKELDINHECILEAIERNDLVKIKKCLQNCKKETFGKSSFQKWRNPLFNPRQSDKAALEQWLELLTHKNDDVHNKAWQNLDTKQTLSHFEKFKTQNSETTSQNHIFKKLICVNNF